MAFLALIFSYPLVLVSYDNKHKDESFYLLKLSALWLLCQFYVTVNGNFRLPLGFITAFLISYNSKVNRQAKFIATAAGVVSFLISILVYYIYKIY